MKPNRLLDPKHLPYFGAIVQAILFGIAGSLFFPNPYFGALVGLGAGAVVNYSMALASSRITTIADGRKPLAYAALVLMFALSPITITLSMFYPHEIYTAIAWAMDVDLAIVLAGAIVGKSLLPVEEKKKQPKRKQAQPAPQQPATLTKVSRKPLTDDILLAYLAENKEQSLELVAQFFGVSRQAISARRKKIYAPKKENV